MTQICPQCETEHASGMHFCPECGYKQPYIAPEGPMNVYNLLTEANLYRMRGDWQTASDICIDILNSVPENVDAHLLLGEIAEGRQRFEDAARWYGIALALDPKRDATAAKLHRVQTRTEESESDEVGEIETLGPSWFDRFVAGDTYERIIRIITITGSTFLLLMLLAGSWELRTRRHHIISAFDLGQPFRRPTAARARFRPPYDVSSDLEVISALNHDAALRNAGVVVASVISDPRSRSLIVTYTLVEGKPLTRSVCLNAAAALATTIFQGFSSVAFVSVRQIGYTPGSSRPVAGTRTEFVFAGDSDRPNPGEDVSFHQDVWWHPAIPDTE